MKLFYKRKDGGPKSTVTGFWLFEIKSLFSIVLLKFGEGTRENFHSHAFNALSIFLPGTDVKEVKLSGNIRNIKGFLIKYTPKACFHKIYAHKTSWCLSFRGPWSPVWHEYDPKTKELIDLTHGRVELQRYKI